MTTNHLSGPWRAVLVADEDGNGRFEVENFDYMTGSDEVDISIRRGTALPDVDGNLPVSYRSGDIIELWEGLYVEDGDPSTDGPARWAQAQAMAAGLNAASAA
ncbi:hypothetical protein [Paractinoplanes maris]|uniref:hypothetical protein n=1 Tax=Paractinoplanes maris TaxID=1734446 RepID=UPI002021F056|nr:hypothetical protein [Actinoplanes maris]